MMIKNPQVQTITLSYLERGVGWFRLLLYIALIPVYGVSYVLGIVFAVVKSAFIKGIKSIEGHWE